MKVLSLSTYDIKGGAAQAAYRLHQGLLQIGVNSSMLVQRKLNEEDSTVFGRIGFSGKINNALRARFDQIPTKIYCNRSSGLFSSSIIPDRLDKKILQLNPEIIHLHWLNAGFLKFENLRKFKKPFVWTLHDSWLFTGGCHVPFECTRYQHSCGKCPILGSKKENDLSHEIWQRKKRTLEKLKLFIITPSRWLAKCAKSSSLLKDFPIEVIPNGIDLNQFKPMDQKIARYTLGLPTEKKLILCFVSSIDRDRHKGFHLLIPALEKLRCTKWHDKAELMICGIDPPKTPLAINFPIHFLGNIQHEAQLVQIYSAADLLVSPSIQDNLPNIVMEALACGIPCVAFRIGGMPDLIEHEYNGFLSKPFEINDLALGMHWILDNLEYQRMLSVNARKSVEKNFEITQIAKRYLDIYKFSCSKSKNIKLQVKA